MTMRFARFLLCSTLACVAVAGATAAAATTTPAAPADARDQFMATLRSMCGARFEGALTYAIEPANPYVGQKMSTEIVCTAADVRLPVRVGEDRSRTWIFTRSGAGLDLRHDHRHSDGTPEPVTLYGGLAAAGGSALSQSFAGDAVTFKLFPGSETNLWTVSLSADGSVLTYHLDRHAKPRIEFVMKRVARSEDVSSIAGLMKAYYDVVSGPAGTARDIGRDKSLHHPDARVYLPNSKGEGDAKVTSMTIEQYHAQAAAMFNDGFYEAEVERSVRMFGNAVQVWSTYASRATPGGPLIGRGINNLIVLFDGKHYSILAETWSPET